MARTIPAPEHLIQLKFSAIQINLNLYTLYDNCLLSPVGQVRSYRNQVAKRKKANRLGWLFSFQINDLNKSGGAGEGNRTVILGLIGR